MQERLTSVQENEQPKRISHKEKRGKEREDRKKRIRTLREPRNIVMTNSDLLKLNHQIAEELRRNNSMRAQSELTARSKRVTGRVATSNVVEADSEIKSERIT